MIWVKGAQLILREFQAKTSAMAQYDKVFGIGLNKTGTTSLKHAFERLGFRHLDRRPRLFKLWRKGRVADVIAASEDYETFEDWPWPLMVSELLEHYGNRALFVLTVRRNPMAWVESLKSHAERTNPHHNPRRAIFGADYPHGMEAAFEAYYDRHNALVRQLFFDRPNQLCELCWENGDGWPELCGFLGVKRPKVEFPYANKSLEAKPNPEFVAENQVLIDAHLKALGQKSFKD